VYYDKINAMLLNEVQKLHRERDAQAEALEAQQRLIEKLESRLAEVESRLK
jgi:hypothetical protein